jgi:hypothetical protein
MPHLSPPRLLALSWLGLAGLCLLAGPSAHASDDPPPPRAIGSDRDYGFKDWKISDADWQAVRAYYTHADRKKNRMTAEQIDHWRPFMHAVNRDGVNPGEFASSFFKPGFPDGLSDRDLAEVGVLNVTAAPFNVTPDDGKDDTLALQDAINFARDHQLVAFLPAGEYHISDTLFLTQGHVREPDGSTRMTETYSCIVVGSTADPDRRTRLVLADGTFTDPEDTQPAVYVHRVGKPEPGSTPLANTATNNYSQLFRAIDLDLGDNPGAWGISFQAPEGSSLQDVTIEAHGATGGVAGFLGSGGAMFDVTVRGGRVGLASTERGFDIPWKGADGTQPGPTVVGVTLIGQTQWAIASASRGGLVIVGADIRSDKAGPLILLASRWWKEPFSNSLGLIDSSIAYASPNPGNTVIEAERGFYLENVYLENASQVHAPALKTAGSGWTHVRQAALGIDDWQGKTRTATLDLDRDGAEEEVTIDIDEAVYLDGQRVGDTHFDASANVEPPADLTASHRLGAWPSFESPNLVNVKDHGAQGDADTDDTAAFRKAIRAAGPGGIVFVPKGQYVVRNTLDLLPHQTLLGVHHKLSRIIGADTETRGRFGDDDDPATGQPVVRTVDAPDDRTRLGFVSIRPNRVWAQHDPTPIGTYGLEWRSGQGQVLGTEIKYERYTNYWELMVLRLYYGLDNKFVRDHYAQSEDAKLDPRVGWEVPDPEGFGDYGNGPGPHGAYPVSPLDHPLVQVRGHGGGQWFQFWNHGYDNVTGDHRTLLVEDTHNPLHLYHLHIQHKRSDAQAEFRNAKNIEVYGIKQEMHGRFLDILSSSKVRVHGFAGIGGPYEDGEPIFWIDADSSDVVITNIGDEPQFNKDSWGALSPRNRLWRAHVMRFPAIQDDTHGLKTPPAARPIMYQIGDPLAD